jgi:hypothetical protein
MNRSGPAVSNAQDIEDIERALRGEDTKKKGKYHQEMTVHYDPRFSKVLSWAGVIFAGVITYAICWSANATVDLEKQMIGVQRDIAALVARPAGISREEFDRDAQHWDDDINALKRADRKPAR